MTEGFPSGLDDKESASNAGDLGSIPGLGRSPGKENGHPLQYSDLENSMDYIADRLSLHFNHYKCQHLFMFVGH